MIARAPGKIVISGAYAVLEGAPAIVAAVDRYVVADGARSSAIVTEEVLAAMSVGVLDQVPWFDASGLRARLPDGTSRKIGLGSSSAILVASLGAAIAEQIPEEDKLRREILPIALAAHRQAQPGGSGIDVVASVRGEVTKCILRPDGAIKVEPFQLPAGLHLQVYACPTASSTSKLLEQVRDLRKNNAALYRSLMDSASAGSMSAATAADAVSFVRALSLQTEALGTLGKLAKAPIVIDAVRELRAIAVDEEATFGPSGAGGGDIALWAGLGPPSETFRARAAELRLEPLEMKIGARGLHIERG